MPRTLLDLPNETLNHVFVFLGSASLSALMRVCPRLRDIGERPLYTDVFLSDSVDGDPNTVVIPPRTLACCNVVANRPYLAQCIRRLQIRWTRDRARRLTECRLAPVVMQKLRELLRAANQIETLELHLAGLPANYDFGSLLDVTTFRLHRLALSGPPDAQIEGFLSTQPFVTYLHLADHHRPVLLSPECLPLLGTFRGNVRYAASIVPGRPVSTLILSGHEISEQQLMALACGREPVRNLDLSALSVTPTQLLTISKHLTALETLRMRLALRHTLHFTFSGMSLQSYFYFYPALLFSPPPLPPPSWHYVDQLHPCLLQPPRTLVSSSLTTASVQMLLSALTQVLGAFTQLRHLDLSPTSVDGVVTTHNERDERALCIAWAGVTPLLRRIRFPSGIEWERTRWASNSGSDAETSMSLGGVSANPNEATWRPLPRFNSPNP